MSLYDIISTDTLNVSASELIWPPVYKLPVNRAIAVALLNGAYSSPSHVRSSDVRRAAVGTTETNRCALHESAFGEVIPMVE